jgi:hypothetical protein
MLVGVIPTEFSILQSNWDVADYAVYVNPSLKDGMPVGYVVYKTTEHTRRQPDFAFEIALDEPWLPFVWRSVPRSLHAAHYFVRDEVLTKLRPYFEPAHLIPPAERPNRN